MKNKDLLKEMRGILDTLNLDCQSFGIELHHNLLPLELVKEREKKLVKEALLALLQLWEGMLGEKKEIPNIFGKNDQAIWYENTGYNAYRASMLKKLEEMKKEVKG